MSGLPLDGRDILFVGGKGGVGKTTTASALALSMAEAGERILLVSTDPAHSLADLFGRSIGDRATPIVPGLEAMEIDPEREVDRYLGTVSQSMKRFVQPEMYGEIERQMELTRSSPGAEEAALMDRVAYLMDEGRTGYDRVVFDTAPTGHTLRLLSLPEIMAAWTDGLLRSRERSDRLGEAVERLRRARREASGDDLSWFDDAEEAPADERTRRIREVLMERRRRFARARRLMLDPATTAFVLVLIPEKLPILESEKALKVLRRHDVPVAGAIVNRVLPEQPLGDFLEHRREQEAEYLRRIDEIMRGLPRVRVPLMARDVEGLDALREVGRYLRG